MQPKLKNYLDLQKVTLSTANHAAKTKTVTKSALKLKDYV